MKPIRLLLLASAGLFAGGLRHAFATANAESTSGTHCATQTKLADGAHSYRHLLVKAGSDADHVALGDATHFPVGVTDDQPSAAEDPVNVRLLGVSNQTVHMIGATAIAAETDVYAAANGFVQALPGSAGTYYRVGRTKAAGLAIASNVYELEVEPCQPEKVAVIVTATGTAATDVAALFTALQAGPIRLKTL
jgi:hypothetical protein